MVFMKLRQERYKPKPQRKRILNFMSLFIGVIIIIMWIFKDSAGIDTPSMFIYTGFGVLIISLAVLNKGRERDIKADDEHLEKLRENMGKNGDSIFF